MKLRLIEIVCSGFKNAQQKPLPEVLHPGAEEPLVLVPRDLAVESGAPALGMSHLAQDPSVGAYQGFHSSHGTVGIGRPFHGLPDWSA